MTAYTKIEMGGLPLYINPNYNPLLPKLGKLSGEAKRKARKKGRQARKSRKIMRRR